MTAVRLALAGKQPPEPPTAACLVEMHGAQPGRKFDLVHGTTTIGRSDTNDICLPFEWIAPKHASIIWDHRGLAICDEASGGKTSVNDRVIEAAALANGDRICLGRTVLRLVVGDKIESAYHAELFRLSTLDALTQVFNRRYFEEWLAREVQSTRRYDRSVSVVAIDIDRFRECNATFGARAGDNVLREVADWLHQGAVGRWGGDRFAIALPIGPLDAAVARAEEMRRSLEECDFTFEDRQIRITISAGVATLASGESAHALMDRAIERLERAKADGGNRVAG